MEVEARYNVIGERLLTHIIDQIRRIPSRSISRVFILTQPKRRALICVAMMNRNSERTRASGGDTSLDSDRGCGTPRVYHLHKRRRPCDQCRERKVRCNSEGEKAPCHRCAQSQTTCTFRRRPLRTRRQVLRHTPEYEPSPLAGYAAEPNPAQEATYIDGDTGTDVDVNVNWEVDEPPAGNGGSASQGPLSGLSYGWASPQGATTEFESLPVATQFSQTIEDLPGQTAMLLGTSSESDPWLLRHCRFDEFGLRRFYGLQYRNLGGVPTMDKIPVHFIVTPDSAHDAAAAETRVVDTSSLRIRLEELIPAECGVRLVKL